MSDRAQRRGEPRDVSARVTPRDTVAVLGAGPIGLLTAQMARIHGASAVLLFDTRPQRLTLGRELGFTHTYAAEIRLGSCCPIPDPAGPRW